VAAKLAWYAARAGRMSPAEVAGGSAIKLSGWPGGGARPALAEMAQGKPPGERGFTAVLPPGTEALVPGPARDAVLASAGALLDGEWDVLGVARTDLAAPDWFHDPVTGRRSAPDRYCFRISTRSPEQTGNIKQVWEISRLQHLTCWLRPCRPGGGLRGPGRGPVAVLVAAEPVPVRRALDQRHRARGAADQPGLDPAAAERLAGGQGPVRAESARGGPDPLASAVPGCLPQPRFLVQ
jgi:hypothetical protein